MLRSSRVTVSLSIVGLALVLVACSSDRNASLTTVAPTIAAAETTAVAETTVAVETTAADTTVVVDTTDAPADFVAFTSDELLAALPTIADLGADWNDSGATAAVDPEGAEGLGIGTCGGLNAAGRALAGNATAIVQGPTQIGSDQRRGATAIYVFADDVAAQAFVDMTADLASCPDGVTWQWIQKANPVAPNEFNGFGPGFEDVTENQTWNFTETATSAYGDDGTDVLLATVERSRELTAAGITFSQVDSTVLRYDRFDNVVITTAISGTWDQQGYIGAEDLVNFQPTADDLDAYTALVQPVVLAHLGWE
ncbi:MAG TPA: hypothetical protein PK020_07375 [Ilumatobacteraceae bacterium]|nr:hypothetical protein [Ilumatobacteraceae bacterium]HRB03197.1 hypothetical protein [Ilumatobacteraceae bacterium]